MVQRIKISSGDQQGVVYKYFKALSMLNGIDLQLNDLNVLVYIALNKELGTSGKKGLKDKLDITEGNLNNVLSRLRKFKLVVTTDKVNKLVKVLDIDFSGTITLIVDLYVPEK